MTSERSLRLAFSAVIRADGYAGRAALERFSHFVPGSPQPFRGPGLYSWIEVGRQAQVRGENLTAVAAFARAIRFGRSRKERVELAAWCRHSIARWPL